MMMNEGDNKYKNVSEIFLRKWFFFVILWLTYMKLGKENLL